MITIRETVCAPIKESKCPSYAADKNCDGMIYDDRPPIPCGQWIGGQDPGTFNYTIDVGTTPGVVTMPYLGFGLMLQPWPGLLEVFIDNVLVATTVEKSGYFGSLTFYYTAGIVTVRVYREPNNDASWNFNFRCPV